MKRTWHEGAQPLEAALNYAARGWPVLPIYAVDDGCCACGTPSCRDTGKHPVGNLVPHGLKNASTAAHTIRPWWQHCPEANIGVVTGAVSGVWVLDVDPRNGGDDSLRDLEARHGVLPLTPRALTGGGGVHYFFRWPSGGVPNGVTLAEGLDVKADGGYVVVPPSGHRSGRRYAWDAAAHPGDVPLALAPPWVLAGVSRRASERLRCDGTPLVIRAGGRNETLMRLGCLLRRYGFGEKALFGSLLAVNAAHCDPPLPEAEVRRLVGSVGRYASGATLSEMSGGTPRRL